MSVLVVGLSHRSAPVEVLERVAVGAPEVPKLLDALLHSEHVGEVLLLSTCNRIEVCAVVDAFHGGLADVSAVLSRHSGMPVPELTEHLYVHYAGAAVQHLFAVAAGLDSMVVGEAQILGQLRGAYAAADAAGTVGRVLHDLAQQALRVGKRVHARTGIDTAGASVVSEALADAAGALGGALAGRRAVLVGAGAMGALAAAHLRRADVDAIVVANRSLPRARRLVDATLQALDAGPYLYRYPPDGRDGFTGREGAFLPVAAWAVTALAATGQVDRARQRLDALCAGLPRLLPEQVDPGSGTGLGNVPLVWSHVELARALHVLDAASVRQRLGPVGLWAWRTGRLLRLRTTR